jgi:hypothetical protein
VRGPKTVCARDCTIKEAVDRHVPKEKKEGLLFIAETIERFTGSG